MGENFEIERKEMKEWSCQCGFSTCGLKAEIPSDELDEIIEKGNVIIVDGCQNNYFSEAELLEKKDGYGIYKLGKLRPDLKPKNISEGGGFVNPL